MTETKKTGFSALVSVDGKVLAGQKDITINEAWQTVSTRDKTTSNAEQVIVTSYSWSTTLDATAVYGENTAQMRANHRKIKQTFRAGKEFEFELNNAETGEKLKGKGVLTSFDTTYPMDDLITISAAVTGNGFLDDLSGGMPVNPDPDGGGGTPMTISIVPNTEGPTDRVILSVTVNNGDSQLDYVDLPDNTSNYSNVFEYEITENGFYTFNAYDTAGGGVSASIQITNIQ